MKATPLIVEGTSPSVHQPGKLAATKQHVQNKIFNREKKMNEVWQENFGHL